MSHAFGHAGGGRSPHYTITKWRCFTLIKAKNFPMLLDIRSACPPLDLLHSEYNLMDAIIISRSSCATAGRRKLRPKFRVCNFPSRERTHAELNLSQPTLQRVVVRIIPTLQLTTTNTSSVYAWRKPNSVNYESDPIRCAS